MSSRNNTNTNSTGGVNEFVELEDCPDTHNPPNAYVVTNGSGTAITYNTTPPTGATSFVELSDTPGFILANQYVIGNGTGTALTYTASAPATSFLALTDTPNTYVGANNLTVVVNPSATGLTFTSQNIPHSFIQLNDTPNTYAGSVPNSIVTVNGASNGLVFSNFPIGDIPTTFTALTDCPDNYVGSSNKIVRVNNAETALIFTDEEPFPFTSLLDVPSSYVGQANKTVQVNNSETGLVFNTVNDPQSFLQLTDTPNSYAGASDQYVKVNVGETGLTFVPGGTGGSSLITLTDNTAGAYTTNNLNMAVAINESANGFQYTNMAYLQGGYPRLVQGMVKGYRNYPGTPGNQGFIYNDTDAEHGEYFYFGTNRTNFNEPRYLNDFWTSRSFSGGSSFYPVVGSTATLDISPKYVGIGGTAHSCGVDLTVPNTISVNPPFANSWYFDVKVDISFRISLGNVDDNIFCMWVCSKQQMDVILGNTDFAKVQEADYFWVNETSGSYPANIAEGHISKVCTFQCGDGFDVPDINVFMSCRRKEDYATKGSFTINSYYYINCSYVVLAMRAPQPSVSDPSLTCETPGVFWT